MDSYNASTIPQPAQEEMTFEDKKQEVEKKKQTFFRVLRLVIFGIITFAAAIAGYFLYKELTKPKVAPIVVDVSEPKPEVPAEVDPTNTNGELNQEWSIYKNDDLKVSLEYPKDTEIEETDEDDITRKVEIIYQTPDTSGYIFRVSVFTTESRNLDEIANIKRDSFTIRCPETASISNVWETTIHDTEARAFEVTNCDSDYKFTYVTKFGMFYEFAQVYKGDLGYKQQYKMRTQELLSSVRFYPEGDAGLLSPYITYSNSGKDAGIKFDHFRLSTDCCEMKGPRSETAKRIVNLFNPDTYIDKSRYDGISFFTDRLNGRDSTALKSYIENEKNRLIDDYKVVRGYVPETSEKIINIADREATVLSGYSWEGDILIYLPQHGSGDNWSSLIIISIRNISGEDFERSVNFTLDSIEIL